MERLTVVSEGPRVLTYSHDGFGLGHLTRSLRLAEALSARRPGTSTLAATGSWVPQYFRFPSKVDYLKIPSLSKLANEHYVARSLAVAPDQILEVRSRVLSAAVAGFRPDLVIVDRYPLGVGGELKPALTALKRQNPAARLVLGFRDVLDDPETIRDEWARGGYSEAIDRFYDRVLIYGSRDVYDAVDAYALPAAVADRAVFTGYLCAPPEEADCEAASEITTGQRLALCTVGGGEDGYDVARVFLDAARRLPSEWRGMLVTGPLMPRERVRSLDAAAQGTQVRVHRFVEDLPACLRAADVVVSMAGYNTMCETLAVGARSIVVPRTRPRTEQLIRAKLFAERGVVRMVLGGELTAARLVEAIHEVMEIPRDQIRARILAGFDVDGIATAAEALLRVLGDGVGGERNQPSEIDLRRADARPS